MNDSNKTVKLLTKKKKGKKTIYYYMGQLCEFNPKTGVAIMKKRVKGFRKLKLK